LAAGHGRVSPLLAWLWAGDGGRGRLEGLETLGSLIAEEPSGVASGFLAPSSGTCWFHGEQELVPGDPPPVDVVVPLGVAHPAVVPQHPLRRKLRDARRL